MRKGHRAIVIASLVAAAAALGRVSAQAPPGARPSAVDAPAAAQDVLPALLAEVRGLRAAMEQMASAGPRVQLFVGRLQLQEARINGMVRRLDTVRDSTAAARQKYDGAVLDLKQFEAAMARAAQPHPEAEQIILQRTRAVSVARSTLDRLVAEETQLTADVTAEQGRWIEINNRLDELERALVRR